MSNEEAEKEEMKEETHDVEDMEQDELDEEDSEDEWSWIHERLIMNLNNEMMQEETQLKDYRKFSLRERYPLREGIYLRLFFATYGMVTNALAGLDRDLYN